MSRCATLIGEGEVAVDYKVTITLIFAGFAVVEAIAGRLLNREHSRWRDVWIELISGLVILILTVPTIMWGGAALLEAVAPGSEGALSGLPLWAMFAVLLVADDLTQYWWHRLSHSVPWLYNLHRAHHSAEYLSVRVVYRNNILYYAMMPGLWISAALIHAGFGVVYPVYIVLKMTVIIGAHSSVPWDSWLIQRPRLWPLLWVLERTISTPATHAAHHGRHAADGVTHYKGNYGNFLFLWDMIFGTAKITRRYPERYGLENIPDERWQTELLWPLVPSARQAD